MRKLRRSASIATIALATIAGVLAFAPEAASAAGPWFVAPGGSAGNTCLSGASPCGTVTQVLAKTGFVSGDTINVAAGTYTDRPVFAAKSANVVGAGSASTIFNGGLAGPSMSLIFGIGGGTQPAATPFSLSGVTLRNGKNSNGLGGGWASIAGVITMNDVVVTANQGVQGAGIYGASSVFTINNSTITANAASGVIASGASAGGALGGGIAIVGGALTSTAGLVVSNNTATGSTTAAVGASPNGGIGGGIALYAGALDLTDASVTGNTATKGYAAGGGIYVNAGTTATITGGAISGNTASAPDVVLDGAGGGVFVAGKSPSVAAGHLTITGTTLASNTANGGGIAAGGNGGAVFNAGTTQLVNGTFSKNLAVASTNTNPRRGMGGAVFNGAQDADDAAVLTMTGGSITNGTGNFTATAGGALANSDPILGGPTPNMTVTGTAISGTIAVIGGAFYNAGTASFVGGTQSGNLAIQGGAGWLNPFVTPTAKPSTTIDGTAFSGNGAVGGSSANGGNGGALFNTGALTIKGGAAFTGNAVTKSTAASSVTGWGGTIFSGPLTTNDKPSVTIDGATFSTSSAVIGGAIATAGNLLGSTTTPSSLSVSNATFTGNTALVGGAIYAAGATTVTGSGFSGNKATDASSGYGGAIVTQRFVATDPAPTLVVDGSALTANTAGVGGGGIAALNGSLEIGNGSTVNGNAAVSGGGVITAVTSRIADSQVNGNAAAFQGGGVYTAAPATGPNPGLTLANAEVDGNTAANAGGGVLGLGPVTATGGEVNGNSAVVGGGLYLADNTTASLDGTSVSGNTATSSAGGGIANGGSLTLRNATLDGNHAATTSTGLGGAILSGSSAENVTTKLVIDASTISNNDAYAGAAIVAVSTKASSTNTTSISRSTIDGNTSTSNIGAIEQAHALSITASTVTRNTSVGGAGALSMFAPTSVTVSGSILAGNGASSCSSHIVDGGYNLVDITDASCGATVAKHDVGGPAALGDLADNGGPTATRLPGNTSTALNQIPAATATGTNDAVTGTAVTLCAAGALDQRGIARSAGGAKCDIGAVEVAQIAPTAITGPNPVELSVGVGVGTPGPTFTTAAGYSPQVTMSVVGTLPNGVSYHDNGDGTLSLTGTPAAGSGGTYDVTIKATNEAGSATFATVIRVHQAPVLQGPASDTYTVGQAGGPDTFTMASGFPPATLSTSSPLPGGVHLVDNGDGTATISGTPDVGTGGVYAIVITGSNGTQPDATFTFTLTVDEGPTITGFGSSTATVGTAYSSPQITTTGTPAATITAVGLPDGLSVTSTGPGTAKITGTPANGEGGEYDVTLHAHNVVGDAEATVHLTVDEAPELTGPTTARIVAGFAGTVSYSADGYPVATITRTGALPAGMSFTDNGNGTATISGTPAVTAAGSYPITITASNGINPNAVVHLTLEIAPPLSISTTSLPNASFGSGYSASITAVGGLPPYQFSLQSGSLPAGLTLTPTGAITGTPTGAVTTSTFTVKVTDAADPAQSATKQLTITVDKGATQLAVSPILLKTQSTGLLGLQITLGVVQARLTGGSPAVPIPGQAIIFTVNGTPVCTGTTGPTGDVICTMSLANTLIATLSGTITASYAGNATWLGSSGSNGLIST
jgi:hypothetical protein